MKNICQHEMCHKQKKRRNPYVWGRKLTNLLSDKKLWQQKRAVGAFEKILNDKVFVVNHVPLTQ